MTAGKLVPATRRIRVGTGKMGGMVQALPESRRCKRGCCWNNFGTCGMRYGCRCHAEPIGNLSARIRLEDFLDSLGDDE